MKLCGDIAYQPRAGESLIDVAAEMVQLVHEYQPDNCYLLFGGTRVRVGPQSTIDIIMK